MVLERDIWNNWLDPSVPAESLIKKLPPGSLRVEQLAEAKDLLHRLMPQRFYVENQIGRGDRHVYVLRSRSFPITRFCSSNR